MTVAQCQPVLNGLAIPSVDFRRSLEGIFSGLSGLLNAQLRSGKHSRPPTKCPSARQSRMPFVQWSGWPEMRSGFRAPYLATSEDKLGADHPGSCLIPCSSGQEPTSLNQVAKSPAKTHTHTEASMSLHNNYTPDRLSSKEETSCAICLQPWHARNPSPRNIFLASIYGAGCRKVEQ